MIKGVLYIMGKITKSDVEERVDLISKVAHRCLIANSDHWNSEMTSSTERAVSRIFYHMVFDSPKIKTGLSTIPHNVKFNTDEHAWDHYLRPQSVAKYIMDNQEENLIDYKRFRYIFDYCRRVVRCTKKENTLLREQTNLHNKPNEFNKKGIYTSEQYINLGIRLFDKHGMVDENVGLPVFDGFSEWEGKFFNNKCRPTVIYSPKKSSLERFLDEKIVDNKLENAA
jgi:hypothetical protein